MAQASATSSKRSSWLKASEVCDLVKIQPYVLRTWELEFPQLGVVKTPGGPRLYRPSDVELALRIKQLVFGEGLTLAGARRRMDEERSSVDELPFDEPDSGGGLSTEARLRIVQIKHEMRALLDLLGGPNGRTSFSTPAPPPSEPSPRSESSPPPAAKPTRKKAVPKGKPAAKVKRRRA
jgi:DNA-binding transcriptional MerR regulator